MSAYNLNVGENVSGRYDVKVRYRNQIRKSSDALYRIYEIWRTRESLYVIYMMSEFKNFFTELLNVIGVISRQCSDCGRNVSVKILTNE